LPQSRLSYRATLGVVLLTQSRRWGPGAASCGLFTQPDPIGLAGGLNLYGYAGGDPVNFSDPFGLFRLEGAAAQQFVRDLQSGARTNLDEPKTHGRCEVAGLLSSYVAAMRSNPGQFASGFSGSRDYPGDFDYKYKYAGDVFEVDGQLLGADEFGNFAAGYAATKAFGGGGFTAARAGGVVFALGGDEHWTDSESAPMINAGARRAMREHPVRVVGAGSRSPMVLRNPPLSPLTSAAGCP
jgi:hypothetical protein